MPKNIVFCADGTWNGPNEDDQDDVPETTNVWKLFLNIAGDPHNSSGLYANEQEVSLSLGGPCVQGAKYLHGVGDTRNPLIKTLGGVFGWGVNAGNVRDETSSSRHDHAQGL